jgi:hypothetical protein
VPAPHHTRDLARALAAAFLDGDWAADGLRARGRSALQPPPRWIDRAATHVLALYHRPPRDRPRELAAVLEDFIARRPARSRRHVRLARAFLPVPATVRAPWPVPRIDTLADLATFLAVGDGELAWLADVRGWERAADPRARNYTYAWVARPGAPVRLLEQPKARLKALQRRVLHEVLDVIPAHDAAHGFVAGRSVRSHAAAHVGAPVVLRFDLEDFFASLAAGRVYGVLRTAGYPEAVAHALTGLTTNSVSRQAWAQIPAPRAPAALVRAHARLARRLASPHLPQGAPTSPMLANLCAFTLDRRLAGLARALDATYTRYADDLVLSAGRGLIREAEALTTTVAAIARDEGLRLNPRKTTIMPRAGRQRVTGVVVNVKPNVAREDYDRLKAILHNAARDGPESQNREGVEDFRAHLLGRIAWVAALHPARGARLRARFDAIAWE